jgi:dipeptidyl-peptidase-4
LNRHQNKLQFFKFDPNTKANQAQLFYTITDEAYVEIDDNLAFLPDGASFISTSEKDGFKHIYRIYFNGNIEQITSGNWDVIEIKGYDSASKNIYYTSAEFSATQKELFSVNLEHKVKTKLSTQPGHTDATFSNGMKYFIQVWSDANTPPVTTLHRQDGTQIQVLEDNKALKEKLESYKLQKKIFLSLEGAADKLNAWMIKPYNFDPTQKHPVYMFVYCGPGSNTVNDKWEGATYLYHQLLAQKGYIVVSVDPRGTQYRGSKFLKSTYLQLGKLEFVDPERLGIQGWSFGGYMSSLAMTKGNGVFKMGIAVAPVTNWRYYDNIYTERFMRTPQENAAGYDQNSPINFCENLEGKYLIIHGSGDDNVHYQNTMEMVNALIKANKQFDMFIYPDRNHGIYGGNTRMHIFDQMLEYTLNNL